MSTASGDCDLNGLGILVTRPAGQAGGLCGLIEAHRGIPVRFPVLEIRKAGTEDDRLRLAHANDYHRLIFISANAVEHAAPHLPRKLNVPVAAVGAATARALRGIGVAEVLAPGGRADSEGLLALPAMQRVEGRRILIVRGLGGRALLADRLRARGAEVEYAEVYRRAPPDNADAQALLREWRERVDVITVTSGEALESLCRLLADDPRLFMPPLIVVSERTAVDARARGFRRVRVARGAADADMLAALCELASSGFSAQT